MFFYHNIWQNLHILVLILCFIFNNRLPIYRHAFFNPKQSPRLLYLSIILESLKNTPFLQLISENKLHLCWMECNDRSGSKWLMGFGHGREGCKNILYLWNYNEGTFFPLFKMTKQILEHSIIWKNIWWERYRPIIYFQYAICLWSK